MRDNFAGKVLRVTSSSLNEVTQDYQSRQFKKSVCIKGLPASLKDLRPQNFIFMWDWSTLKI